MYEVVRLGKGVLALSELNFSSRGSLERQAILLFIRARKLWVMGQSEIVVE
jgi:hypothetical protein